MHATCTDQLACRLCAHTPLAEAHCACQAQRALQGAQPAGAVHRGLPHPLWLVVPVHRQGAHDMEQRRRMDMRGEGVCAPGSEQQWLVLGCTPGQQELPTNAMYTMYNISWHPFLCLTPSHTCMQVDLQAGQRIEYKYVILEEQVRLPASGGALDCTCTSHPIHTALMAL